MCVSSQQLPLEVESPAGHEREEGELSGEEPLRQPSDELQLSLSYHSGGAPAALAFNIQSAYAFCLAAALPTQRYHNTSCGAARVPN